MTSRGNAVNAVVEWTEELFPALPTSSPEVAFALQLLGFSFVPLEQSAMRDAFRAVRQVCHQLYPAAEIEWFPAVRALRLIHLVAQEFPSKYASRNKASSTVMVRLSLRG